MNITPEYNHSHKILLVDDEANILKSLKRVFRKQDYTIYTTTSPTEGMNIIHQESISLVLSDQRMPEMNGSEFLAQVKNESPDTMRILLTGYSDMEAATQAVNDGGIYKFLSKPWEDELLKLTVGRALEKYDLKEENKKLTELTKQQNESLNQINQSLEKKVQERTLEIAEKNKLLEQRIFETIKIFSRILNLRNPLMSNHGKRVEAAVRYMAEQLDLRENDKEQISIAALLHDVGMIGMPDNIVNTNFTRLSETKQEQFKQHTIIGENCVKLISGFETVAGMIRSHHEHIDGTGYPDKLLGEAIPLGSRIIAIADAYDEMVNAGNIKPQAALETIKQQAGTLYDPNLIPLFRDYLESSGVQKQDEIEKVTRLDNLEPGMVLSRELLTVNQTLLAPEKTTITESLIQKLKNFQNTNPIVDDIYIYR